MAYRKKYGPFRKTLRRVSHYLLKESVSCKSTKIQDPHPWCAPCDCANSDFANPNECANFVFANSNECANFDFANPNECANFDFARMSVQNSLFPHYSAKYAIPLHPDLSRPGQTRLFWE